MHYVVHVSYMWYILYISYSLYAVQVICVPKQRDVCRNIRTSYTYAHQTNTIFPEDSVGISTYMYIYIYKKHAIATDHIWPWQKKRYQSHDKFLFHRLLFPWHDMFQALELLKRMEFTDVISYSGSISACDAQLSLEMGFDQPAMGMCLWKHAKPGTFQWRDHGT